MIKIEKMLTYWVRVVKPFVVFWRPFETGTLPGKLKKQPGAGPLGHSAGLMTDWGLNIVIGKAK